MTSSAYSYCILRLRPLPVLAEGLPDPRLREIAGTISGARPLVPGPSDTFPVPVDADAFDPDLVASIHRHLASSLSDSDFLLLDMDYDRTGGRYSVLDILLYQAMLMLDRTLLEGKRIVVLVADRLSPTDDLSLLASHEKFNQSVAIVDTSGEVSTGSAPDWLPEENEGDSVWLSLIELRRYVTGRFLRRRGVFASRTQYGEDYSAFRYSGEKCVAELQDLIAEYLAEHDMDFVVFDGLGAKWFQEAVVAACSEGGVAAFTPEDLSRAQVEDDKLEAVSENARRLVADTTSKFCIVVAAFKAGRRLSEIQLVCSGLGRDDGRTLAIMCDVPQGAEVDVHSVYDTARLQLGETETPVDFLVPVTISLLSDDSWQVRVAEILGEVEASNSHRRLPTRVAMWSMFAEYGSRREYAVPKSRPAISYFPQIRRLDQWDSHWLAEALVSLAEAELGCTRDRLLVVVPDEKTAIRRISEAVEKRLAVAVAKVERSALQGKAAVPPSTELTMRSYRHGRILILDESTVTYRTLTRLNEIVHEVTGRRANLLASVIELGIPGHVRPTNLVSLAQWTPLRIDGRGSR